MIYQGQILENVNRIADDLLKSAIWSKDGIYWKTAALGNKLEISRKSQTGIFNGVAGILAFFSKLYQLQPISIYKDIIQGISQWIINNINHQEFAHGFFNGTIGSLIVVYNASRLIKDEVSKQKVINIINNIVLDSKTTTTDMSLLSGYSGTLLGLIHLMRIDEVNGNLKNNIDNTLEIILRNTLFFPNSVSWATSLFEFTRNPCGYLYGNSGIALALSEYAEIFTQNEIHNLSQQAINYENQLFIKGVNNWPDFSLFSFDKKSSVQFNKNVIKNNYNFFCQWSDSLALSTGLSGIGLSRLRFYNIYKDNRYIVDTENVIEKLKRIKGNSNNFSIFNGTTGYMLFLLELMSYTQNQEYSIILNNLIEETINYRDRNNYYPFIAKESGILEDSGLFLGISGIGYLLLLYIEMNNLNEVDNILFPFKKKNNSNNSGEKEEITKTPVNEGSTNNIKDEFYLKNKLLAPPKVSGKLETEKSRFLFNSETLIWTDVIKSTNIRFLELNKDKDISFLYNARFKLSPNAKIIEFENNFYLLVKDLRGVKEFKIKQITFDFLNQLRKPKRLSQIFKQFKMRKDDNSILIELIIFTLKHGILYRII